MSRREPKRGSGAPGPERVRGRAGRAARGVGARTSSDAPAARDGTEAGGPAGFTAVNWILLGAAVACIVIGYVLLDRGSITAAPILLVLGYAVLIPAGLLVGSRRRAPETEEAP